MSFSAQYWVRQYGMQPHPEGGYFVETYRSRETVARPALPARFSGERSFSTGIYFLLETKHFSAFHRIQADEMWHFYTGRPLEIYVIDPAGTLKVIRLGPDPEAGEVFQAVVPAGCWFSSKPVADGNGPPYSLVGCTVAPGFDFADFELAQRQTLLAHFPEHRSVIERLTH